MMKSFAWIVADVDQLYLFSLNRVCIQITFNPDAFELVFIKKNLNLCVLWGLDEGVRITSHLH